MIDFNIPPYVGKEKEYINKAIDSRKICGDGQYTKKCHEWLNEKTNSHVLLTTSCSHSLDMSAILSNIKEGDEVIMSPFTFVSTADAFVLRGAKIVFIDIRPDTMNIDENLIEAAITPKTKAIVPVHYAGVACEMDKIMEIAKKYNLIVIEDAAQGVMSEYKGKALGTIGDFGCFSFHETKNYSMGEGGAIIVKDYNDFERAEINKDKTGVEIKGIKAINPLTGTEIPVWISDYVLSTYGTGAIMAVPAHDTRDYEFATKFNLPIIQVVGGDNVDLSKEAFTDVSTGKLINSGFLNGLEVKDAKKKVIEYLEEHNIGAKKVNYKLRDWVFSRQRYWGEPIPMVHCEKCGWVPIPEEELPLQLPEVEDFEPGENGESPLAKMTDWINTTCPHCGAPAKRETDTMPQWAGSSWYFLRYMDPHNDKYLASKEALEYWSPVDWYNGGMEHTTLHLLYSRFWHKFLYDIGVVPTKEPYQKRTSHGMILGDNGEKMSKSKGNVINPDDIVDEFGADTFRVYEMFMGPFDQSAAWSMDSIRGCSKFLDRVWNLQTILIDGDAYSSEMEKTMHKSIKKVTNDIEEMKFNTCVSTFMTMVNEFYKLKRINKAELKTFITLLNPFAPHITEELNKIAGFEEDISTYEWPSFDESKTIDDTVTIAIQFNGKLKGTIDVQKDSEEDIVKEKVHNEIDSKLDGKQVVKEIYVKNKIYNIVVK